MAAQDRLDVALKILRIARGLSQKQLEETSGVRNNAISKYESGKATPKLDTLLKLTAGLGLPLSTIEAAKLFVIEVNAKATAGGGRLAGLRQGTEDPRSSEELQREIDQVSNEAGRLVSRFSSLMLDLLARKRDRPP